MPKIAITDYSFPDLSIEESVLQPAGIEIVSFKEKRSPSELANLVGDADGERFSLNETISMPAGWSTDSSMLRSGKE